MRRLLFALLFTLCGRHVAVAALPPERILATIDSLRDASQWIAAAEFAESHVAAARADGDSTLLLQLIMRQGSIWSGTGRVQRAENALSEALSLAEAQRDTTALCYVLRWLGVAISNQGRCAEASALLERLLIAARQIGSATYEGWALVGLAWEAMSAGEYRTAIALYHEAIPPLRLAHQPDGLAWAFNGLATAQMSLGAFDQALADYRRAAARAAEIDVLAMRHYVRNNVLNNLAGLEYRFGDPSAAAEHFREAYELLRSAGNTHAAIIPGINVALCLHEAGHAVAALAELDSLATACRRAGYHDRLGKVLLHRAAIYQDTHQLSAAAAALHCALALGDSLSARDRIAVHAHLARVLSDADSGAVAMDLLTEGFRLLDQIPEIDWELKMRTVLGRVLLRAGRNEEAIIELRSVAEREEELGYIRLSLEALALAARAYQALNLPDSALAYLARAARVWETDRGAPLDPEWREERGAVSREIYTDLALLHLDARNDLAPEDRLRTAFDRLQIFKARTLMERVRGPGFAQDFPTSEQITLERLQHEVLMPGELLLDAFFGPRASLIFGVTRDSCRVVRLPPDRVLERKLRLFHGMVATPPSADSLLDGAMFAAVQAELRSLCFGGWEQILENCTRVILSPDGLLNLLPISYLLPRNVGVTRVPSATYFTWLRSHVREQSGNEALRLLAVAGGLPGAVDEVRRLRRDYANVDVLIAEEDGLLRDWAMLFGDYDALHLAAHAEADDQNPWRSRIIFSPQRDEGSLFADHIAGLNLGTRLTVLSSCSTASGRILSGEGVQGLCTAFLSAGVPAVLATLWEVEDRATARFMERFYAYLAAGGPAVDALRAAQTELRGDSRTRHPYFWAGFVLVGDGDARIPLTRQGRILDRKILLGMILAMMLLYIALRGLLRIRSGGKWPTSVI